MGEKFCLAELVERSNVSNTLAVFRFLPAEKLTFTAGQYATIAIEANGESLERPYSIASSPSERFLEFFVELVPAGLLTPKLWEMKLGASVMIRRRIVGQLTLDSGVRRHLMVATVTGVAPFVSIVRALRTDSKRGVSSGDQILLIHGASHTPDFGPYLGELQTLSRDGWLTYIPTISRAWAEPNWQGETGRIEDVMRKHADRMGFFHSNSVVYACGHPQMVQNVKDILMRARFKEDQIKQEEYFAVPELPASAIKHLDPSHSACVSP